MSRGATDPDERVGMYESFFGLQGKPFQLNPDPQFYFGSRGHNRALAYLQYGLYQGEGFIVITGEIGAGKTTLVGHLLETLDRSRFVAARVVSTQLQGDDIVRGAHDIAEGVPEGLRGHTLPKFRPGGILLVHAGGAAGLFSTMIGGWLNGAAGSQPVTREVTWR